MESYIFVQRNSVKFIDPLQFLIGSLAILVENLEQAGVDKFYQLRSNNQTEST